MDSTANLIGTSHGRGPAPGAAKTRPMRKFVAAHARSSSISDGEGEDFPTEFGASSYRRDHYYHRYQAALQPASDLEQAEPYTASRSRHKYPPSPPRERHYHQQQQPTPSIAVYPCDSSPPRLYTMTTPTMESTARLAGQEPGSPSDTLVGSPVQKCGSRGSDREKIPWRQEGSRPSTAADSKKTQPNSLESQAPAGQDPFSSSAEEASKAKKGARFWLILISLMVVIALSAIDLVSGLTPSHIDLQRGDLTYSPHRLSYRQSSVLPFQRSSRTSASRPSRAPGSRRPSCSR